MTSVSVFISVSVGKIRTPFSRPRGVWTDIVDIIVLDLAFLLYQIYGSIFDPWEGLCGYKLISLHVFVSNVVILE